MHIASTGVTTWEKGAIPRAAYSVREVAEQLGLSEASVWRAVKRGQFESVLIGGRRVITARSVDRALAISAA